MRAGHKDSPLDGADEARLDGAGHPEPGSPTEIRNGGAGYVRRTLIALDHLAARSLTPAELALALEVDRRTAVRLLEVLVSTGWADRDPEKLGYFRLTSRIVTRAGEVMARSNLLRIAAPFVRRVRDQLDESSHLAIPSRGVVIQVLEELSSHPLAVTMRLGERVPAHSTAIGKAIAAYRSDLLDAAIALGLTSFTPNTRVTLAALERELAAVRANGYATDDEEMYAGTRCIGAPVRSGFGVVIAAIGISGPTVRLTSERIPQYARMVVEAADGLSAALGHLPS